MLTRQPPRVSLYSATLGTDSTEPPKPNTNGPGTRKLQREGSAPRAGHPLRLLLHGDAGALLLPLDRRAVTRERLGAHRDTHPRPALVLSRRWHPAGMGFTAAPPHRTAARQEAALEAAGDAG